MTAAAVSRPISTPAGRRRMGTSAHDDGDDGHTRHKARRSRDLTRRRNRSIRGPTVVYFSTVAFLVSVGAVSNLRSGYGRGYWSVGVHHSPTPTIAPSVER